VSEDDTCPSITLCHVGESASSKSACSLPLCGWKERQEIEKTNHEHFGATIESVDDHLSLGLTNELNDSLSNKEKKKSDLLDQ